MKSKNPVIQQSAYCLAHLPDLVRFGSKPRREINVDPSVDGQIHNSTRSFAEALRYPPNRVFIGDLSPDELNGLERPWFGTDDPGPELSSVGSFGEIVPQELFYVLMKHADVLHPPLFELSPHGAERLRQAIGKYACDFPALSDDFHCEPDAEIEREIENEGALRILDGDELIGCFRADRRAEGYGDNNLSAPHLLESVCSKASGAHALHSLLKRSEIGPAQVDFLISCGEEACGDRYQRGGGGLAKSIGELCGCVNATGMDVKNFCAAPASALMTAGALVQTGIFKRVVVLGGGSMAKLGMKFQGFLEAGIPILDDCLASMAFLVTADDGRSPILHLEPGAVGLASIGSSASDQAVYRHLILEPLETLGLGMNDIDRYAPELHNPEIMQFAGSGDVTNKNYRMIAAMGVLSGLMTKSEMPDFIERIGMPGFAPTQGHIPSAVPYIGHAARAMEQGSIQRAMFLCKASLFLNRITELFDGASFVLEKNPGA